MSEAGKWLIYAGVALVVIGGIMLYAPWAISWFGRLPGDIRIDGENGRVFIPVTSMIIVSVVLSVVVNLLRRW
jgi:hypothetical protein